MCRHGTIADAVFLVCSTKVPFFSWLHTQNILCKFMHKNIFLSTPHSFPILGMRAQMYSLPSLGNASILGRVNSMLSASPLSNLRYQIPPNIIPRVNPSSNYEAQALGLLQEWIDGMRWGGMGWMGWMNKSAIGGVVSSSLALFLSRS